MPPPNIHPSAEIGEHVVVSPTARIGPNCYLDGVIRIGENTSLVGGITLVGDATIGDDCLIEAGVSFTALPPAAGAANATIVIGSRSRIGASSTLARGVTIGTDAQVAVGAFVCRNVPSHAIVGGNPAGIVGYDTHGVTKNPIHQESGREVGAFRARTSSVEGVRFYQYPIISDARGDLTVADFGPEFPFVPKRYFVVFNVPSAANRGEHAHRVCQEMLVCLTGSVVVVVDDGTRREEIVLSDPNVGLYLGPSVWRLQYRYSKECIVLVFASTPYDTSDYIYDYQQFLTERRDRG